MFANFEKYIHLPPTKIKNIATSVLFVTVLLDLYIMNKIILEFSNSEHTWENNINKDGQILINILVKFMFLYLKNVA